MIRDITIGQYYPAKSILHRLDPRVKVVSTLLFLISLFLFRSIPGYIISCDGSTFVKSTVWLYCERSEADYHDFDVDGIISVVPDKRRCHISSLVDLYDHRRRTGKCGVYGDPIDLSDYWIIINDIYNDTE